MRDDQLMSSHDGAAASFERERRHLLAVAFRILGSHADADDVVQEAWTRFDHVDVSEIRNVQAWLTTVVTRLCLDRLRRMRETPRPAADLPEPAAIAGDGPEEVVLLAGELLAAMSVVVSRLTPPQRVALILHDVFGIPFDEIASMLDTTAESAKKLASRARQRLRDTSSSSAETVDADPRAPEVVAAFLQAAKIGDLDGLAAVLHPDVIRTADPHALPPGATQELRGAPAVIAETRALRRNAARARLVGVDGEPGIAIFDGTQVETVLVLHVVGGYIVRYDVVADPARLARLSIAD